MTITTGPGDDRVFVRDHPVHPPINDFVFGTELPVHIDLGTGGDYVLTGVRHYDDVIAARPVKASTGSPAGATP